MFDLCCKDSLFPPLNMFYHAAYSIQIVHCLFLTSSECILQLFTPHVCRRKIQCVKVLLIMIHQSMRRDSCTSGSSTLTRPPLLSVHMDLPPHNQGSEQLSPSWLLVKHQQSGRPLDGHWQAAARGICAATGAFTAHTLSRGREVDSHHRIDQSFCPLLNKLLLVGFVHRVIQIIDLSDSNTVIIILSIVLNSIGQLKAEESFLHAGLRLRQHCLAMLSF